MDFSKMRHRITFLVPKGTYKNSMGENVPKYVEYKTVWAYAAPKSGREYDEAQKVRDETTYNILTRFHKGITSEMRVRFNDRIFSIISVLNIDERNEQLNIVAIEVDEYGKKQ